jgi:ornithine cyclodeaminase/alanine dehydrogenase
MTLYISNFEVQSVLGMDEAIKVVEDGFKEFCLGRVQMPQRVALNIFKVEGWVGVMPVYIEKTDVLTVKIVSAYPKNINLGFPTIVGLLVYLDSKTGFPLAIIEAEHLTAVRTGAASGVATKYLAKKTIENVGIFGSGSQAKTQLEALCRVREIRLVKVYSPNSQHRNSFAKEMSKNLGLEVVPVENPKFAVKNSDIVVTATNSKKPVLNGRWLEEGVHLNAIGAHTPTTRELDDLTIKKSKIVVDSKESALKEAGDLVIPLNKKVISRRKIYAELGEIVLGRKKGRVSENEITLFKSVGLAFQDAVVAQIVYEKAKKLGLGVEIKPKAYP